MTNDYSESELKRIHKLSSKHKQLINNSKFCGCFYCLQVFPSNEIVEWIMDPHNANNATAECPKCSIDSVIGDDTVEISQGLLQAMKNYWF